MKTVVKGLLVVFGLSISMASADFLGEADDAYIGFQLTTPLDLRSGNLFSDRIRYHYLLIRQEDGIKDGIAFTEDSNGSQVLNYLRPSTTLDIGESIISEHAVPIMRLDAEAGSNTKSSTSYAVGGLVALVVVGAIVKRDLEKPWKPASP
ncbi:MAG: hypothetical protein OES20_13340 [Gammaproteobacteria bacterium]|nr:hypothetical protein [Gammaproteobacteria bacterium]MDH3856766.1 hypothetical protein [Gammaproteobacteria bacterium]